MTEFDSEDGSTSPGPLKCDVTIAEKNLDPDNDNYSFIKSVNIQEFISSNLSFQYGPNGLCLQKYSTNYESDEEWQINIDSGELSITEVVEPIKTNNDKYRNDNFHNVSIAENNLPYGGDKRIFSEEVETFLETNASFFNSESFLQSNKPRLNTNLPASKTSGAIMWTNECCIGECFAFCKDFCTGGELRTCGLCDYQTQHLTLLQLHLRTHTVNGKKDISNDKRYHCDQCDYSTRKSYSLKSHKRTHTGEKPFVCDLCPFACNDGSTLKRHKYTHTGYKPYSCEKCTYRCTRNSHLQRHIRTHSLGNKYVCDKCDFSCDLKTVLHAHKIEHSDKKLMNCPSCVYVTIDKSSMRRHKLIHSEDKPHCCDRCDYKCRRNSHLRRHLKSHDRKDMLKVQEDNDLNPLICHGCGFFAEHAYVLAAHNCTRQDDSFFYCNRCEFCTESATELKLHKSGHIKPRLPCNLCPYTSDNYISFKKHVLSHSKVKKYPCKDCVYSTDHFSSMRKHKLNHSEDYRHKCDSCSYSSKRLLNLKRHQEIHTNGESIVQGNKLIDNNSVIKDDKSIIQKVNANDKVSNWLQKLENISEEELREINSDLNNCIDSNLTAIVERDTSKLNVKHNSTDFSLNLVEGLRDIVKAKLDNLEFLSNTEKINSKNKPALLKSDNLAVNHLKLDQNLNFQFKVPLPPSTEYINVVKTKNVIPKPKIKRKIKKSSNEIKEIKTSSQIERQDAESCIKMYEIAKIGRGLNSDDVILPNRKALIDENPKSSSIKKKKHNSISSFNKSPLTDLLHNNNSITDGIDLNKKSDSKIELPNADF